ncbi:MAG: AraC family transcriptional regulator [Alcanivorax borkumensis]|jgi:AraC-like DNA-binding protein|uniref:Transcriptional regulator, AraC family n=3 Tax=Pseudomonadati TaxID=3379134 RepID=Q0VSF4_ALCBS|nr:MULTISPECIES: AraC family transcriptional regulator [Alcanivorax]EUC68146.1 AraC family transcriptional regulator [Alcanivorax sp. 97CO-5]OJH06854.1 MAG: AraC family transcriptional regulator [Alcanivorax borkumensis]BAP13312.1 AraC family transcriptional regulator [Alcanivorax sp. NBRC 101098]CAL15894.1 transcriptional regulator, AraC family [Alcanivorax borkumensis SK2]
MTILKMDPEEYSVSAEYLALLLAVLSRRGVATETLLEGTRIEPGCWRNPQARITAQDFERVAIRAIELSGEPWLGWELGASMTLSSHGFLGYAAMSSATLGEALELAVKYFRTRSTLVQLETFTDGDMAVMQINELLALGELAPLIMESLFSSFHFMGEKLVPGQEVIGELRFSYPEPDYFARLRPVMPVPVYFDCAYNQMRFPVERMKYTLQFADPRLARMAADQCEQEMATIKLPPPLLGQVRRIILGGGGRFPGVEEVAGELHMSSRTLKRKLQQLGTSYQEVLDGLRKGLAVEYLTQSEKTVDEIAMTLGYSDASNFARAFRRWTARSPSDYRP